MILSRRSVLSTLAVSSLQAQVAEHKLGSRSSVFWATIAKKIWRSRRLRVQQHGTLGAGKNESRSGDGERCATREGEASLARNGLYLSVVGSTLNHVDSDLAKRKQVNDAFKKVIEIAGKLGASYVGSGSGAMLGKSLDENVAEIVRVYTEQYFPVCQKYNIRILWEPYPGSPNVATGSVGYDALFKAFGNSPYVGLQYDPSHLVWQMMDPIQTARDFIDKIYDVHLKDTEVFTRVLRRCGINPPDKTKWWRYRIPGLGQMDWPAFFTVLQDAGYSGAMNIEHEDQVYGDPQRGDIFNENYKVGFRMGYRYLRQYIPV